MIQEVPAGEWCPFLEGFSREHRALQQTDIGAVRPLEIETPEGQRIRLAFRATALPEQLDGLAPGELSFSERSTEPTATLTAATHL